VVVDPPAKFGTDRDQTWRALAGLFCAHVLLVVIFNPTGPTNAHDEWTYLVVLGIVFVQPMLFASWLSLGPPPAAKRIPFTIAAAVAVCLATGIKHWSFFARPSSANSLDFDWMILDSAFFGIFALVGFILRKFFHWHIANKSSMSAGLVLNQFSLKYLLALTTICALLLSIGRNLAMHRDTRMISDLLTPMGIILLAMFPAMIVPVLTLSKRPAWPIVLIIVAAWATLSWLAVQSIVAQGPFSPGKSEMIQQILFLQLGGTIAGGGSALVLRLSGYRLFGRNTSDTKC
jgi:hypothetical protein